MVGNSSVTTTLCVLALHATMPHSIAAEEEATNAIDEFTSNSDYGRNGNRGRNKRTRKRHLRRHRRDHQPKDIKNNYAWSPKYRSNHDNPTGEQQEGDEPRRQLALSSDCPWFPDNLNKDGCTNDPDKINPIWLQTPALQAQLFRPTGQDCCDAFFAGSPDCKLYPNCDSDEASAGSGGSTSSCVVPGWYPDSRRRDGCTNGQSYQEDWLKPTMINIIFKPTSNDCCASFYPGKVCKAYDEGCIVDGTKFGIEPAPAPTVGDSQPGQVLSSSNSKCETEWHPDVKMRSGCTNDPNDYPSEWKSPENKPKYFAETAYACCQNFSMYGSCDTRDTCKGGGIVKLQVTNNPTAKPTPGPPTAAPTTNEPTLAPVPPTPPPTNEPTTRQPTSQPTSFIWLMRSGYCVQNSEVRKPKTVTKRYSTFDDCCSDSHLEVRCRRDAPPPPTQRPTEPRPTVAPTTYEPTFTAQPVTPAPTIGLKFFIDYLSGSCIDAKKNRAPHWIKDTDIYTDYWDCCDNSFAKAQCIREGPSKGYSFEPTSRPSALESDVPSSQPSDLHSYVPSGQPSEPTSAPTTLYWGALRTFSAKPTQRPTVADCSDLSWHADADIDQGCTNLDLSPTQTAVMLFQTMEDCCNILFGGLECAVNDQCRLTNIIVPADENIPENCGNDWHPIMSYPRDGCSNSPDIPSSWRQPENRHGLLFDSVIDCCQQHHIDKGNHCRIDSHCSTLSPTTKRPTPLPTPRVTYPEPIAPKPAPSTNQVEASACENAKWHIAMGANEMACSNSLTYPALWNHPGMKEKFLFSTHYDCCAHFSFGNIDACAKHDVCIYEVRATQLGVTAGKSAPSGSSCESAKWHMTQDFTKCSNSINYPEVWLDFEDKYFSDEPEECCLKTFNYRDCEIEDVCSDAGETTTVSNTTTGPTMTSVAEDTETTATTTEEPSNPINSVEVVVEKCSGKTRRQCFYDTECQYDTTGRICTSASAVSESSPQHQPPNESTTDAPGPTQAKLPTRNPSHAGSESLNDSSDECRGKPMRRCRDDPGCKYDVTSETCTSVLAESKPIKVKSFTTPNSPTNIQTNTSANNVLDECSGKPMRRCRDDPRCKYNEMSQTCSTVLKLPQTMEHHDLGEKPAAYSITCEELSKKYCVRETDCVWDKEGKSCYRLDQLANDVDKGGEVVQTVTEGCNERMWHPKSLSNPTCSNSLDYPSIWNNPSLPRKYLFTSFNKCCEAFYDGYCQKEDTCR